MARLDYVLERPGVMVKRGSDGLRLLTASQVRTIATGALVCALWAGAALVVSVGRTAWSKHPLHDLAGLSAFVGTVWAVMFCLFLVGVAKAVRDAATVKSAYRIATIGDTSELELTWVTHHPPAEFIGECMQFIRQTFRVLELHEDDTDHISVKLKPLASFYFHCNVQIWVRASNTGDHIVRIVTQTPSLLGFPLVDSGGISTLVLIASWAQKRPLPTSRWPALMWKTIVSSVDYSSVSLSVSQ